MSSGKELFEDNSQTEIKIPFGRSNVTPLGIYDGTEFWGNQDSFASPT